MRMHRSIRPRAAIALASVVLVLGGGARQPAWASAGRCRGAIAKVSAIFVQARAKALAGCWDKVVRRKIVGPCPDVRSDAVIAKARDKLFATIAKVCGGADKTCGTQPDESLASLGWNLGDCVALGHPACAHALQDCNDVSACVACVGADDVDRVFDLYVDPAALAAASSGADKRFVTCLRQLAKVGGASLGKTTSLFNACWIHVNKADSGGSFSCPDPKAGIRAARLKGMVVGQICRACGGTDLKCGGDDDVAPSALGFPTDCPAVATCGGAVQTLEDVARCATCVTNALADDASRSAIPLFASTVPPVCPMPSPTPP